MFLHIATLLLLDLYVFALLSAFTLTRDFSRLATILKSFENIVLSSLRTRVVRNFAHRKYSSTFLGNFQCFLFVTLRYQTMMWTFYHEQRILCALNLATAKILANFSFMRYIFIYSFEIFQKYAQHTYLIWIPKL